MVAAVDCAANALQTSTKEYADLQRGVMEASLNSAMTSHSAVRAVLGLGPENPASVHALALARISLEGLYNICLFTESRDWVDQYLKDDWKKQYVQLLLKREETKRFADYTAKVRQLKECGEAVGITEDEIATVDREQLGAPRGSGRTRKIKPFPTPWRAIQALEEGSNKRKMLERLYCEYSFLCNFVHGSFTASFYNTTFDSTSSVRHSWSGSELDDMFHQEVATPACIVSRLGVVQATAEIAVLYPNNVGLRAAVATAWNEMSRDSLLGRAVWHLRTKALLGVVG